MTHVEKRRMKKDEQIREATLLLIKGRITVNDFLSCMVYKHKNKCINMVTKLDIFKKISDEELEVEYLKLPICSNENYCPKALSENSE